MKRSEINSIIDDARELLNRHGILLPPFSAWTPGEWSRKGHEADEIRDNALGWDVTDFGQGDFAQQGLVLFTLRNGNLRLHDRYPKVYAEKVMIAREGQMTPFHFHWQKREDIINRGGGNLVVEVFKAGKDEARSEERFTLSIDGMKREFSAGEIFTIPPGSSVTFDPYIYHKFYGERGTGTVILGEVSSVNDDANDNRFLTPLGRYPKIEEDVPATHFLCSEYPPAP